MVLQTSLVFWILAQTSTSITSLKRSQMGAVLGLPYCLRF